MNKQRHSLQTIIPTILSPIDGFLNVIPMYQMVLRTLLLLALIAFFFTLTGILSITPFAFIVSLTLFVGSSYILNLIFAKLINAPTNFESSLITGFILFFIFTPPSLQIPSSALDSTAAVTGVLFSRFLEPIVAVLIAIASKYLIAFRKQHVFNPVAIAAVVIPSLGFAGASWWVATPVLFPFALIAALLLIQKVRRWGLVTSFIGAALLSIAFTNSNFVQMGLTSYPTLLREVFVSWPLIFFASIMLTEPYTMPPTRTLQVIYGVIIGLLFGSRFQIGPFFSTPEFALLIGNIFTVIVSRRQRLILPLIEKTIVGNEMYSFRFQKPAGFTFKAGQYLEWLLPLNFLQGEFPDLRGNRRYFTIASAPSEDTLLLGVKIPAQQPSYFKQRLNSLAIGDYLVAGQLAGDFTLDDLPITQPIVMIAGGVGITPFRSMLLEEAHAARSITLFYCVRHPDELLYYDELRAASKKNKNHTLIPVITRTEHIPPKWHGLSGRLTPQQLTNTLGIIDTTVFFLSGPNTMVHAYKKLLLTIGVKPHAIKEDYFPGF